MEAREFFPGSAAYWEHRYSQGRGSGPGSIGRLAEFKAATLNDLVRRLRIDSVIEFGCGDGAQLALCEYPAYLGFDVSAAAVSRCRHAFAADETKTFKALDAYAGETADCALSIDVIYHLVEEEVFAAYMQRLFAAASRYVIIYSSNFDRPRQTGAAHIRHRKFSDWIERHRPRWTLAEQIPAKYPFNGDTNNGSFSDFHLYQNRRLFP